jgi:glycosyltransferase involved in cell wall biosynthesis
VAAAARDRGAGADRRGEAPLSAPGVEPLRIAFVITRADAVGGANVHVRDLARWLRERGHDARVLAGGDGPFLDLLREADVPHERLPALGRALHPVRDLRAAAQLHAALRRLRPQVLSLHTAKAGALGRLVAPLHGLRPLYTPHGWAFTDGVPEREARRYRRLERLLARLPGLLLNVCEHERKVALAAGVGRADQHVVVHNGMPERPELRLAEPARSPSELVMVARFEEPKDHATLLRALARIDPGLPWRLTLVGDGPLRRDTEALADALDLRARVRFAGAVADVAPLLGAAQAFALTTRWEGFPRSIL